MSPTLHGNFAFTLTGNVVYAACQWAVLMAFAKLGNIEKLGQYALAIAIATPVFQLAGLLLRNVQVTDAKNRYSFAEYGAMRLSTSAVAVAVVAAIALFGHRFSQTALIVALVGVSKAVESLGDICMGLFQKHERMDRVAISLILKGVLSLVAVAIVLKLSGSPVAACATLAVVWAVVWAGYDLRVAAGQLGGASALLPKIDPGTFRQLFMRTLPLGFVMMLLSLNGNLPRYFLEKHLGAASVGAFSALMYCVSAENLVMAALGQAAAPRLAKLYCAGEMRSFVSLLSKIAGLGACVGLIGLVAAKVAGAWILTLLYGPEYARQVDAFAWLMAAGALLNVSGILGVATTAMQGFTQQVWIHLGCFVVTLVASAVLIPVAGIAGAAYSVVILATVGLVGYSLQVGLMVTGHRVPAPILAGGLSK